MKKYRVVLTHGERKWEGVVEASCVDAALAKAKAEQGFPERTTSETQRIEG